MFEFILKSDVFSKADILQAEIVIASIARIDRSDRSV